MRTIAVTNYQHTKTSPTILSPGCTSLRLVPSPRGALVCLSPQTKLQASPNWNLKHYKSVEFLSILNVKPTLPERKPPPHKRKASLLTTFWRRFCLRWHEFSSCTSTNKRAQILSWSCQKAYGSSFIRSCCIPADNLNRCRLVNFFEKYVRRTPLTRNSNQTFYGFVATCNWGI